MVGGQEGLIHSTGAGSRGQSASWGPAETWRQRERGETRWKRCGVEGCVLGDGDRDLEKQSGTEKPGGARV